MIRLIYLINITLINLISRYTLYIFHSFINSTLQLYSKYQDYNCEYLWINSSFRKSMNLFWTNGGKKKENSINQSIIMQSILVQSIPSPLRPSPPPVRIEAIQFLVLFHRASPDTLFGRSIRGGGRREEGGGYCCYPLGDRSGQVACVHPAAMWVHYIGAHRYTGPH